MIYIYIFIYLFIYIYIYIYLFIQIMYTKILSCSKRGEHFEMLLCAEGKGRSQGPPAERIPFVPAGVRGPTSEGVCHLCQ